MSASTIANNTIDFFAPSIIKYICLVGIFFFSFTSNHKEAISSDIKITATKNENNIFLKCETIITYNNGGFVIDFKKKVKEKTICIDFKSIRFPKRATRNIEPAKVVISLGKLKEGEYSLMICTFKNENNLNDAGNNKVYFQKDSAVLLVSKNNVQLKLLSNNSIVVFE